MVASFVFELRKLGKRPATWVLGAVLVLAVTVFDYAQLYLAYQAVQEEGAPPPGVPVEDSGEFEAFLLPKSLPVQVAGFLATFGGPIALILGALSAGSEYGWGTFKTILTQGMGRIGVLSSKLLAVGAALLLFALVAFGAGAVSSYVVAGLLEASVEWPAAGDVLKGLGVTWLIFGAWASLGVSLAMLFRGTALSIGLGLVYGFVLENLIFGFSDQSEVIDAIRKALLSKNSNDLTASVGEAPQIFATPDPVEPFQAALVLAAYVAVPLLLSMLLFRRRDFVD